MSAAEIDLPRQPMQREETIMFPEIPYYLVDENMQFIYELETVGDIDGLNAGLSAGLEAAAAGGDVAAVATEAAAAAGATAAAAAGIGALVASVAGVLVVAGILATIIALLINESITILIVNNTPYELSTSTDPANEQIYINHGKMVAAAAPIAPNSSSDGGSGFIFQNDEGALLGPSGAIWVNVMEPGNGSLVAGLCIAFSDPVSGSNSGKVAFNESLRPWFEQFNEEPATSVSSATFDGPPSLQATSTLNPSGSKTVMVVSLTTA